MQCSAFGVALFIRDPSTIKGWKYLGYIPNFKGEFFTIAEDAEGSMWTVTSDGIGHRITLSVDEHGNPEMSKTQVDNFGPEQGLKGTSTGSVFAMNQKIYFTSDSVTYTFNKQKNSFEKTSFHGITNLHNASGVIAFKSYG